MILIELFIVIVKPLLVWFIRGHHQRIIGLLPSTIIIYFVIIALFVIFYKKVKKNYIHFPPIRYLLILSLPCILNSFFLSLSNLQVLKENIKFAGNFYITAIFIAVVFSVYYDKQIRFWNMISVFTLISTGISFIEYTLGPLSPDHAIDRYPGFWHLAYRQSNISFLSFWGLYTVRSVLKKKSKLIDIGIVAAISGMILSGHRTSLLFSIVFLALFHFPSKHWLKYLIRNIRKLIICFVIVFVFITRTDLGEKYTKTFINIQQVFNVTDKTELVENPIMIQTTIGSFFVRLAIFNDIYNRFIEADLINQAFGHGAKKVYTVQAEIFNNTTLLTDVGSTYAAWLYDFGIVGIFIFFYFVYILYNFRPINYKSLKYYPKITKSLRLFIVLFIFYSLVETIFVDLIIGFHFWMIICGVFMLFHQQSVIKGTTKNYL